MQLHLNHLNFLLNPLHMTIWQNSNCCCVSGPSLQLTKTSCNSNEGKRHRLQMNVAWRTHVNITLSAKKAVRYCAISVLTKPRASAQRQANHSSNFIHIRPFSKECYHVRSISSDSHTSSKTNFKTFGTAKLLDAMNISKSLPTLSVVFTMTRFQMQIKQQKLVCPKKYRTVLETNQNIKRSGEAFKVYCEKLKITTCFASWLSTLWKQSIG